MKKAIIIHGSPSKAEIDAVPGYRCSEQHWLPWVRHELAVRGVRAQTPEMPMPWNPDYAAWKAVFEACNPDTGTVLVGHSAGAGFLLQYLSELEPGMRFGDVVLVAPWIDPAKPFALDPDLMQKTASCTVLYSTDDEQEVLATVAELKNALPAVSFVEFHDKGHFTAEDLGGEAFPELLDALHVSRLWFKRKTYGYGWTPSTWQGWLVMAAWLCVFVLLMTNSKRPHVLAAIASVIVLIAICWAKGEKPQWQWGAKK